MLYTQLKKTLICAVTYVDLGIRTYTSIKNDHGHVRTWIWQRDIHGHVYVIWEWEYMHEKMLTAAMAN